MSAKNQSKRGTFINLPPGLKEALKLYLLPRNQSITQFVAELVADEVIAKLEALPHDVGQTLGVMYPGQDVTKKYRELVKNVHIRQGAKQAQPEEQEEEMVEEYDDEEEAVINSNILDSITESS